MRTVETCNNCQRRENANESACKGISERSARPAFLNDHETCVRWEAEPNKFYFLEEKWLFRSLPYYPKTPEAYNEGNKDGSLVKVMDIANAFITLNNWKRSVIIFYDWCPVDDSYDRSMELFPGNYSAFNCGNQKHLTELLEAVIPRIGFDYLIIEDHWDKTEEDVSLAAAAAPPSVPPPPNDRGEVPW